MLPPSGKPVDDVDAGATFKEKPTVGLVVAGAPPRENPADPPRVNPGVVVLGVAPNEIAPAVLGGTPKVGTAGNWKKSTKSNFD